MPEAYFDETVRAFVATERASVGRVGNATSHVRWKRSASRSRRLGSPWPRIASTPWAAAAPCPLAPAGFAATVSRGPIVTANVVVVLALTLALGAGGCRRAPDDEMQGKTGPSTAMGNGTSTSGGGGPADGGGGTGAPGAGQSGDR
jgi:hypothetical protein